MSKFLLVFIFFFTLSFAKEYPLAFERLGTPLYETLEPISKYSHVKSLQKEIDVYAKKANEAMINGFAVDASKDKDKTKEYLLELRKLQKNYDWLLHLLRQNISKSIDDKNYARFCELTNYEFDGLMQNKNLCNKSMTFYAKNRSKKKIALLEKIINDEKLLKESEEEFYIQAMESTYTPNSKNAARKESVYMQTTRVGNTLEVTLFNSNIYDVTVNATAKLENVSQSKNTRSAVVIKSKSSVKYATLTFGDGKTSYQYSYSWRIGGMDAVHDDGYTYRLPYAKGDSHRVSQGFNGSQTHKGPSSYAVDFMMDKGTKVYSAREGIVIQTKSDSNVGGYEKKFSKDGNFVTTLHEDGTFGTYYHLKKNGVVVNVGEKVGKGQHLGYSGSTGYSSGPHLHFAVFKAASASSTQSLPIVFESAKGVVKAPVVGRKYTAL